MIRVFMETVQGKRGQTRERDCERREQSANRAAAALQDDKIVMFNLRAF
jgi:hypothetical protein